MLRHVVLLEFPPSADAETIARIWRGFDDLAARMPGARAVTCGANVTPEHPLDRGYTHGFVMDFDGAAARDAYLAHPDHVAFAKDVVIPALADGVDSICVFDYEIEQA